MLGGSARARCLPRPLRAGRREASLHARRQGLRQPSATGIARVLASLERGRLGGGGGALTRALRIQKHSSSGSHAGERPGIRSSNPLMSRISGRRPRNCSNRSPQIAHEQNAGFFFVSSLSPDFTAVAGEVRATYGFPKGRSRTPQDTEFRSTPPVRRHQIHRTRNPLEKRAVERHNEAPRLRRVACSCRAVRVPSRSRSRSRSRSESDVCAPSERRDGVTGERA